MSTIPTLELATASAILDEQLKLVQQALRYVHSSSTFYQRHFQKIPLDLSNFTWADFKKLPTTSKDDLQNYNWDFLCVEKKEIAEYTSTSGTLGRPVTIALTSNDVQRLAYNEAISFACSDGSKDDLYQLMLTLDRQFMAGIAYYEGIRKLGAGLIRVGPGLPALQWETIQKLQPTTLVAVPSFIVKLIEYAELNGLDLNSTSVKKAICIGEAIRSRSLALTPIAERITRAWNIKLYSTYASTEMQTAFTECKEGVGGHVHPELIYVELLDDNGQQVPDGEAGEVTVTTLGVEGMPLIRYRTGDIAQLYNEPCACGRNTARLSPIVGRKQQMIKLKGTTLYPPAIFDLLANDGVKDFIVEALTNELGVDEVRLHISANGNQQGLERELLSQFQSRLRVTPQILFSSQEQIEKQQQSGSSRKLKKFIDNRK